MMSDTAVRALSNDELDAISGGKTVVCVRTQHVRFFGMNLNWATCANGQEIFYVTQD
jgi:hypothetical protein